MPVRRGSRRQEEIRRAEPIHDPGDKPVDGRADIYALGCVAYWLLTGSLVFEGSSPMDLLTKHLRDDEGPIGRHG